MDRNKRRTESRGRVGAGVLVFLLWALTAVLGFGCIIYTREIVLETLARFGFVRGHQLANYVVIFTMAILYIGVVIGGAEYHFRRIGEPGSWRLFTRTLAVELSILALRLFI